MRKHRNRWPGNPPGLQINPNHRKGSLRQRLERLLREKPEVLLRIAYGRPPG